MKAKATNRLRLNRNKSPCKAVDKETGKPAGPGYGKGQGRGNGKGRNISTSKKKT